MSVKEIIERRIIECNKIADNHKQLRLEFKGRVSELDSLLKELKKLKLI